MDQLKFEDGTPVEDVPDLTTEPQTLDERIAEHNASLRTEMRTDDLDHVERIVKIATAVRSSQKGQELVERMREKGHDQDDHLVPIATTAQERGIIAIGINVARVLLPEWQDAALDLGEKINDAILSERPEEFIESEREAMDAVVEDLQMEAMAEFFGMSLEEFKAQAEEQALLDATEDQPVI